MRPHRSQMEGDALPCSRPARYALRAIYDVLPQHRPVFRLSAPKPQALLRPQKSDDTEVIPPAVFRKALPRRLRVRRPHRSKLVGLARRRRPKPQAHSAVSRADDDFFEFDVLFDRGGLRRKSRTARRSIPTISFRKALPRRVRVRRPHRSQMVGSARRSGPKHQAHSAVSRADDDLFELDVLFDRGGQAAKVGRRRRGIPTISLR